MDHETAPPHVDFAGINALSSRPAGYAVAWKCLQVQAEAERRDPSLRSEKRVELHQDAWSWYQGALGEIEVGELLRGLGPEWFVRHSVPIGAGTKDVDHLIIGPGGVFAINTKHHAGASVWVGDHVLRVNNGNTHHLTGARRDALDVGQRLSLKVGFPVPVTPVVAVLNARSIKDGRSVRDRSIAVQDARQLVTWLRARPAQLSQTKIDLLKLAAEEPGTWHVDPRAADTFRVMQRFERLVDRVAEPKAESQRALPSGASPRTQRPAAGSASPSSALADVLRLWFGAALIVIPILIFRGIADQPCANPTACFLPGIYLAWKPFLLLGMAFAVGAAVLGTARVLIRHWRKR